MLTLLKGIQNRFPTVHIAAVSICGVILSITLLLLPSAEVSATKDTSLTTERPTQNAVQKELIEQSAERIHNDLVLNISGSESAFTPLVPAANKNTTQIKATLPTNNPTISTYETPDENWVSYTVQKNDNLTSLFLRAGLNATDVYNISQATLEGKELNQIYPGEALAFLIEGSVLKKLKYEVNPLRTIVIQLLGSDYVVNAIERTPDTHERYIEGVINNSLFVDAEHAGLSNNMIMRFAAIFGWDVDFSQGIRQGDRFRVIYNEQFLDGKKIKDGHIVAAQFVNNGETFTAIRYTDSDGSSRYYTPDGHSMRKAFLRMPVDFARISSGFNLSRKHPVLNRIRAHKGVDYAASTGTPIKASGDGKIIWKGTKGGYGRAIIIQHGSNITTLYAHMSKYNSKLQQGSRVKQGQVIGYVGKSGLATGPHLHYEFRVNGAHKNPMTVKFPQASPVAKRELVAFQAVSDQMQAQLETYSTIKYARAE
ncbi:peptidoglycan DD-metalloendopeptidase family protein [Neptunomonas antarctica]|uniref:Murein DD-endopeptidase MepM and murein hydrolase activator NlpD, contain LysM domain n=1 Tax=Neptunomonas antarctica TaxID=619304 RepID=A0A1N7PLW8_9GAMM|nr:peptidoglycan DD-metalloendopeptidase family protein [Neptunomonas antarctica]SIT11633.1 Murein DD-endopeptidase MepM and murein hydrolase activator NlpD, contain LysM domain [Neptunomonas antarctica]